MLAAIKAATGQSTVPQVFVGGRLLGGASEVVPLIQSGALQQQLAATTAPPLPPELAALVAKAAAAGQAAQASAAASSDERGKLAGLAAQLRAAVASSSARTFTLQQAVQWLGSSQGLAADAAAATLAQLQAAQLLTLADAGPGSADAQQALTPALATQRPQLLLRLTEDAPAPTRWQEPLNGQFAWFGRACPAEQVRWWAGDGRGSCRWAGGPRLPLRLGWLTRDVPPPAGAPLTLPCTGGGGGEAGHCTAVRRTHVPGRPAGGPTAAASASASSQLLSHLSQQQARTQRLTPAAPPSAPTPPACAARWTIEPCEQTPPGPSL